MKNKNPTYYSWGGGENPAHLRRAPSMAVSTHIRLRTCGDSGNRFPISRETQKIKSAVIEVIGNRAEFRPPSAIRRDGRFRRKCDSWNLAIRKIIGARSRNIAKWEIKIIRSRVAKSDRNPRPSHLWRPSGWPFSTQMRLRNGNGAVDFSPTVAQKRKTE